MPAKLFQPPFGVNEPDHLVFPAVLNSPHSGRIYPRSFLDASRLDPTRLRMSEDCFVDELFHGAVQRGAPLMTALFPRAYLDVNREPFELDQAMFSDTLPGYVNTASPRVAGGLGTIARVISETDEIYRNKLMFSEAKARIQALYVPYHETLANLIERSLEIFGTVLLIDCHSMPSFDRLRRNTVRPDIVLGDRCGTSCAPQIVDFLEEQLTKLGFSVVRNQPYAGGYITERHGHPNQGRHAVQIEVNRALYLNESLLTKHEGFRALKSALNQLLDNLKANWRGLTPTFRIAAE